MPAVSGFRIAAGHATDQRSAKQLQHNCL